jgi:(2Fe-2S) ferredoxin
MEPSFKVWVTKAVDRWRAASGNGAAWPAIRLAPPPVTVAPFAAMVGEMVAAALAGEPLAPPAKLPAEATLVPAQKYRVLVCMGGPCNNAGATAVWNHFRREQDRLQLRTTGPGVMSCKTSGLGPCELAPVVQVFPEATYYGGVDEAAVDRIVAEHLQGGRVVADFAYTPTGKKQSLRRRKARAAPAATKSREQEPTP